VPASSANSRSLHIGLGEDESAGGRDHAVVIELEHGPPPQNEVQPLVAVRLRLVVLVENPVACLTTGPRVDTEGGDAEVVPDGSPGRAPVVHLVDLVEVRDRVAAH